MMKKIFTIMICSGALSACATFSNEPNPLIEEQKQTIAAQQNQAQDLQFVIAELRSENARLSRTIKSLKRSRQAAVEKTETLEKQAEVIAAEKTAEAERRKILVVPAPPKNPNAIILAERDALPLTSSAVPVESNPRLVEPSFTAGSAVFENEADTAIETSSVLYGVHLASYRKTSEAIAGWRKLQHTNPDLLGLLEPRVESVTIVGRGEFIRLIAGGFSSQEKALSLCETLKSKNSYCAMTNFSGERLDIPGAR